MPTIQELDPYYYSPQEPIEATLQPRYEKGWLNDLGTYFQRSGEALARIPGGVSRALDWAGTNVAQPSLQEMSRLYGTDWSQQPFIGVGEKGELTGRIPALASTITPYLAGGAPGGNTLGAGIKLPGGREGGYHGTQHTFSPTERNTLGEFTDTTIGTGEGAQAYGYGHYIAAEPEVAKSYMPPQEHVVTLDDKPWQITADTLHEHIAKSAILDDYPWTYTGGRFVPDVDRTIDRLSKHIYNVERDKQLWDPNDPVGARQLRMIDKGINDQKRAVDFLEQNKDRIGIGQESPGNLYQVEIRPPEEHFLDLDMPLREQSREVQRGIQKAQVLMPRSRLWTREPEATLRTSRAEQLLDPNITGQEAHNILGRAYGGDFVDRPGARNILMISGIAGNRYRDQFSRNLMAPQHYQSQIDEARHFQEISTDPSDKAFWTSRIGELQREWEEAKNPTYNYVVFDPNQLNIVGRE